MYAIVRNGADLLHTRIKTTQRKIRDVQTIDKICQGNPDPKIPVKLFITVTEAKVIQKPETATIVSGREKMADTSPEKPRSADGHREPTLLTLFCRKPRTVTCSLDSRTENTRIFKPNQNRHADSEEEVSSKKKVIRIIVGAHFSMGRSPGKKKESAAATLKIVPGIKSAIQTTTVNEKAEVVREGKIVRSFGIDRWLRGSVF